ncbi:HNH endonuclease-domain-containing protein [Peziza echinospora]|nr:HNH endonuclease-domain-containing protein [Peziza echinospora]
MPFDRSFGRNVHFYDASVPDITLGGLFQNGSVTEANFLAMLDILLITETPIRVQERGSGHNIITRTNTPLGLGEYDVYCDSLISVNSEPWVQRLRSCNVSGREEPFENGVRLRDRKCVISGVVNPRSRVENGVWAGFEAAHIFPLHAEDLWINNHYDTNGVSKINSIQNGMLLQASIHQMFDQYMVSVNPDDSYKVIVFDEDYLGIDGRVLDPVCRDADDVHHVADDLLRWHYRQSVLANMRGAGEPIFEHDFPPGTDMVREIREGPCAKERFELELAARLGAAV